MKRLKKNVFIFCVKEWEKGGKKERRPRNEIILVVALLTPTAFVSDVKDIS